MKNSDLLKQIVSIGSITETPGESRVEAFIADEMSQIPYFEQNPDLFGREFIPGDQHGRAINWGLVRGSSPHTIVMINHHDVVAVDDYGPLKNLAFCTEQLARRALEISESQPLTGDLNTGQWMMGRGTADMKAGLVIQLDVLKRYSQRKERGASLLFLSVPDEENASLGMRWGAVFLGRLKEKYSLSYVLAVNSESHERGDKSRPVIHRGSAGKFMLCVHVKGKQAHLGEVLKGFNPLGLLSRIAAQTDINFSLADGGLSQLVPPPAWSYLRDNKAHYDASIPDSASGLLCFLCAQAGPEQIVNKVKAQIETIVKEYMEQNNKAVLSSSGEGDEEKKISIMTYSQLLSEAQARDADVRETERERLRRAVEEGTSYYNATRESIQRLIEFRGFAYPVVALAVVPPYYPAVASHSNSVYEHILAGLQERFQTLEEPFYLGISDLSYLMWNSQMDSKILIENMPLWDSGIYTIPFEIMKDFHVDIINAGPWGKDLHQASERVYIPDVDITIPDMIEEIIESYNRISKWEKGGGQ